MICFNAYVPTRESDAVEVRIRSDAAGPVILELAETAVTLDAPNRSHRGGHFYRHRFEDLPPDTVFELCATRHSDHVRTRIKTATLPPPPGPLKLRVGILADLHLSRGRARINDYRPGTKRLIGLAGELAARYIRRLERLGADLIVLPGDLVDPCTDETLHQLRGILDSVSIPCYPIIGNHEPWSHRGEARFCEALGLPEHGYYQVQKNGVRLLMLNTPAPDALGPGSRQLRWLEEQLTDVGPAEDVVLFSHFSLNLHRCVQGYRNDGYQLLDHHRAVNRLLERHPRVRLFIAGHKNIPSMMIKGGVIHTLSPQLIQAPCGYDIFRLYEGGAARTTFEIDEQHYVEVARAAYASDYLARYGDETARNFCLRYGAP